MIAGYVIVWQNAQTHTCGSGPMWLSYTMARSQITALNSSFRVRGWHFAVPVYECKES